MDIAWRLALQFVLAGTSPVGVRAAVDGNRCLLHDESAPLSSKRLRAWSKVTDHRLATAEHLAALKRAVASRDVVRLQQRLPALIQFLCARISILSQQDSTPSEGRRSVQLWFSSGVQSGGNVRRSTCTHGPPHALFTGTMIAIEFSAEGAPFLADFFVIQRHLTCDPTLWDTGTRACLETPAKYGPVDTPRRVIQATPATTNGPAAGEDSVWCDVCSRHITFEGMYFVEACGHGACWTCMTACAQRHCLSPGATPTNMPCPHYGCSKLLEPHELRSLLSNIQFTELERTEVMLALREGGVSCPQCTFMFESVADAALALDPLADKLTCSMCNTSFCRLCERFPYHDGRQCLDGGVAVDAPRCRYCGNAATSMQPLTCDSKECEGKGKNSCLVPKRCGHQCHGTCGERTCVPCLEEGCREAHPGGQLADDLCLICYTDSLRDAPCIELECGHIFHFHCVVSKLEKQWPTSRIGFHFFSCTFCNQDISHSLLHRWTEPILRLRETLDSRYAARIALERQTHHITDPASVYFDKPIDYGRDRLNYYMCAKCQRPYFGGLRECQDVDREEPDRSDLVCGGCSSGSAAICSVHGVQYMEWKCKFCCNTAVWYCWGTTHFCELCHAPPRKSVRVECPGEEACPLRGNHLPNGVEFAIGCAMCRAQQK